MTRTIEKVGYEAGNHTTTISYVETGEDSREERHTVACNDLPRPAFLRALAALAPHIAEIVEVKANYAADMEIRRVSFNYHHGVMGAVVTAIKPLTTCKGSLLVNTPHQPETAYGDSDGDEGLMDERFAQALKKVLAEADAYLEGKRAQGRLPLKSD